MAEKKKKGKSVWKVILTVFGVFMAVLLITAAVFAGTLYMMMGLICGDTSPAAKKTFVTTVLETGQLKFLASWYLSPDEIQELVDQNSMKEFNEEVNTSLIKIDGKKSESGGTTETDDTKEEKPIEVIGISGRMYYATLMIIKDPSRVSLATIYPWRDYGVTLDELVKSAGAVAGINGGLYDSTNNTGGRAMGVVVSHGEIQMNKPNDRRGLVLIGLTEDNILEIIDMEGMSKTDVENLVRDRKIRDATTFQEESSDANNHFVQLIINGKSRELNGQGSGLNPRTAIGQRADGAILFLVTDGRGASGHLGASAADLIQIMEEYGAVNAANLDGGSSSCMYYDGDYLMTSVTFYHSTSSWKLPLGFVVN